MVILRTGASCIKLSIDFIIKLRVQKKPRFCIRTKFFRFIKPCVRQNLSFINPSQGKTVRSCISTLSPPEITRYVRNNWWWAIEFLEKLGKTEVVMRPRCKAESNSYNNNSTAQSQLFRLYYGCHTSRNWSDYIFQGIRPVFLLKIAIVSRIISSASHLRPLFANYKT